MIRPTLRGEGRRSTPLIRRLRLLRTPWHRRPAPGSESCRLNRPTFWRPCIKIKPCRSNLGAGLIIWKRRRHERSIRQFCSPAYGNSALRLGESESLPAVEYLQPKDLSEALQEIARPDRASKLLAGGTDLQVGIRQGIYTPDAIVDIAGLGELRGISINEDKVVIGA